MESKASLPCSQEPATCSYPEPRASIPCSPILFLQEHHIIISSHRHQLCIFWSVYADEACLVLKYCQRILWQLLLASFFKHEVQAVRIFQPTYESVNHQLLCSLETLPTHFSNSTIVPQVQPLCSTTVLTLHPDTIFPTILFPVMKWECDVASVRSVSATVHSYFVFPPSILHTASVSTDIFFCTFFTLRDSNFYNKIVRQNIGFLRSTLQPDFLVAKTPAVENFCMYFMVHQAPTNYQFLPYSLGAGQFSQHSDQTTSWMTAKSWIDTRHG